MKLIDEYHPDADVLRQKLESFYECPVGYTAFENSSEHPGPWSYVVDVIRRFAEQGVPCRILEVGAGRSGFAEHLAGKGLRSKVHYTAQDVTRANEDFLRMAADEFIIGPLENLSGSYDVIFSTYVWEHLTAPRQALDRWLEMLMKDGCLFIFSPRYDLPGYLSPSADQVSHFARLLLSFQLFWARLKTRFGASPKFYLHADPAVFHMPWRIDRDAVHWPSFFDLRTCVGENFKLQQLSLPHGPSWRDYVLKRWLTLAVRIDRC